MAGQNKTMLEKNRRVKKWDIKNRKMMEDMRSASGAYFEDYTIWHTTHKPYAEAKACNTNKSTVKYGTTAALEIALKKLQKNPMFKGVVVLS